MTSGLTLASASASFIDGGELAVGDQHLGFGMVELKAMIAASSRVLSECSTALVIGTP